MHISRVVILFCIMVDGQAVRSTDLVTEIQARLNEICAMFFNFAGALQRDAAPTAVLDEPVSETVNARPKHDIREMALQIAQASKLLDGLIEQLPSLTQTEQEQLQRVAKIKVIYAGWVSACQVLLIKGQRQCHAYGPVFGRYRKIVTSKAQCCERQYERLKAGWRLFKAYLLC